MSISHTDTKQNKLHTTQTSDTVSTKVQEFTAAVVDKASEATHQIGEQIEALGKSIREQAPSEGTLGTAAAAADTLEGAGTYFQEKDLEHMVKDLTSMVQRYPLQSLLVGIGLGYLLARSTDR
jgi:hypothetical protein